MVRYKTEPGEKEQKILAEISLNTPNNLKRRKVTSAVSAVLCVIYAAFAVWMFARSVYYQHDFTSQEKKSHPLSV